ncbi:mitochondrial large subunit ribosomal protein-domain-containing protein [Fomitopsis serialis]|uniref:mitochondrial large subunit ribosomal protein-domain-containing protein n=1 Tax=Fomitopsis serialis TaxID=139415 RepID=UPI002007B2E2|nr:mitochondrial large subunit ribosomal protein-domain-containing protein [Neoantrodia serialis]KAH9934824.1 mitochondrial large subunit ribosomal protein-domain-containing protein [Neoantrodia serialis]
MHVPHTLPAQLRAYTTAVAHAPPVYRVPRNTRGAMPVYTDIRNAGTRHLTLIRNIEGNASALAQDLASSLHPSGSPEAQRMRVQVLHSKHVVLSGGMWKTQVVRWLVDRGF